MALAQDILNNPLLVALFAIVLLGIAQFVRQVGPREAILHDRFRRVLWRNLDDYCTKLGRPLLVDKTHADEQVPDDPKEIVVDALEA